MATNKKINSLMTELRSKSLEHPTIKPAYKNSDHEINVFDKFGTSTLPSHYNFDLSTHDGQGGSRFPRKSMVPSKEGSKEPKFSFQESEMDELLKLNLNLFDGKKAVTRPYSKTDRL
jgi:lysozyme family protein